MSSRADRKRQAREARERAEAQARGQEQRRRRLRLTGLALVGLLVAAAAGFAMIQGIGADGEGSSAGRSNIPASEIPPVRIGDYEEAVKAAGARKLDQPYDTGQNDHTTEPVDYPTNPPLNGRHHPTWTQDGNYAGLEAPQTEKVVHALEHGRIVVQYRPDIEPRVLSQLVGLYDEDPYHVLLVQNATGMREPVAVTAWSKGLVFPKVTPGMFDAIRAFTTKYRDKGPELVP